MNPPDAVHPNIERRLRLKLLACSVFTREACWCIARSPHVVDPEFLSIARHTHSASLRAGLQARLDALAEEQPAYDAVLLLYGLCGNATVGLTARNAPLVLPRAHDCATILLGDRARFAEHFKDRPSRPFSSPGYQERGDYFLNSSGGLTGGNAENSYAALVEQYGEDNAEYLWETLQCGSDGESLFIAIPELAGLGHEEQFSRQAAQDGKPFLRLEGGLRLVRMLVDAEWPDGEFLTVPPGQSIKGLYDWDRIVAAL